MKKSHIYALITVALYSFCFTLLISPKQTIAEEKAVFEPIEIQATGKKLAYDIEIAKTEQQLEKGLMYRKDMPENEGMLFLFGDGRSVNIWMKNTVIPLDILFIDKSGKIVYIKQNAAPYSLDIINAGNEQVAAVLELNGGQTQKKNINVGDTVIYKGFKK